MPCDINILGCNKISLLETSVSRTMNKYRVFCEGKGWEGNYKGFVRERLVTVLTHQSTSAEKS